MSDENVEFQWGRKRGVGAKNKAVKFYESFKFDDVDYELYDCVYLWKEDEVEPDVGKIVRIWEDKSKMVKILWFFKPVQVLKYLDDARIMENELFLASGEGVGVTNVNPLETIAGKCNVLCIMKDDRNPYPTKEELQGADFVFHQVFDVDKLALSDKIPDKVAGIDIKYIFNRRDSQHSGAATKLCIDKKVRNDRCPSQTDTGNVGNSPKPSQDQSSAPKKVDTARKHHLMENDCDESESRDYKKPRFHNGMNLSKEMDKSNQSQDPHVPSRMKGKSLLSSGSNRICLGKGSKFEDAECNASGPVTTNRESITSSHATQKPNVDSSSWFRELSWEEKLENANRQGKLVLLEKLDPSYTSADVQDIILHGFEESCKVKMLYCATNCYPLSASGQAFVVFKTKEIAEKVITKMKQELLMLSNGSPLIASFGKPCFPRKETLIGHFEVNKLKFQSKEKKEAVSTVHCSQPNSVEYGYAMEWCLLQEKFSQQWKILHEEQTKERRKIMLELKTKLI